MGEFYTFNQSVRGHVHCLRDLPLQDASFSCSSSVENSQFHIAVVADGHGDPSCMRSGTGSRLAAEAAHDSLRQFAQDVLDGQPVEGVPSAGEQLAIKKYRDAALRRLTDSIISRWYAAVHQDALNPPLSEEDLKKAGRIHHAYGTTLIAALMLPDYLVLIQQGDGQCVVFYEDGTVEQPIPPDPRCHANVTTSLCDEDAAEGIRSCVVDLGTKKAAACYLGSDGVEDSFRNTEGLHMFYRGLSCEICSQGTEAFGEYLAEMLPQFSAQGSGDDISVSGIVDLDRIAELAEDYRSQVQRHRLEEKLANCRQRIASMARKHDILRKRMQTARTEYESLRQQVDTSSSDLNRMKEECKEASNRAKKEQKNLKILTKRFDDIQRNSIWGKSDSRLKKIDDAAKKCHISRSKWQNKENWLEIRLSDQNEKIKDLDKNLKEAQQQYQQASDEFKEYDSSYQSLRAEEEKIREEIEALETAESPAVLQSAAVVPEELEAGAQETVSEAASDEAEPVAAEPSEPDCGGQQTEPPSMEINEGLS